MWENVASGPWFFNNWRDKTTVRGPMEAGKNSVIHMGLVPGPHKADNICVKMKVMGTMQWGSTVHVLHWKQIPSFVIAISVPINHRHWHEQESSYNMIQQITWNSYLWDARRELRLLERRKSSWRMRWEPGLRTLLVICEVVQCRSVKRKTVDTKN